MKGAVYSEFNGLIEISSLPEPSLTPGSVILKVLATGICRSDWYGWQGHDGDIVLPHVPGHELVGEIVEVSHEISNWKEGDRVTLPFVAGCGKCGECISGNEQVCDSQFQPGFTAWGSFAEYVRIEYAANNLVRVPADMESTEAASLGCRFITAYRGLIDQANLKEDQIVAIHGCGGVGLSAILIAKAVGAQVLAIDIRDDALELARTLGADFVINGTSVGDIPEAARSHSKGGAHISLDAIGNSKVAQNSIRSLRKRGVHIQIGLLEQGHRQIPLPMDIIVANELEIKGSHGMQAHKYPEMFSLLKEKGILLNPLIGDVVNLSEGVTRLMEMDIRPNRGITVINDFTH